MTTILPAEDIDLKIKGFEGVKGELKDMELSILRALPQIVFMLDSKEKFTFVNDTCLQKFLIKSDKLGKGLYLKDVLTDESYRTLKKLHREILTKNEFHASELTGVRSDGTTFPFTAYSARLKKKNRITGFIGIGFDLTERKEIENCLHEANATKSKFFSIIAHDLRNPFNSLIGFSQLLMKNCDKYPSEKVKEYVSYINLAAQQGFVLLENLLEWSRAQTGKLDVNKTSFDIVRVIFETSNLLSASASKKEIDINFVCPTHLFVQADENMIHTVLRNLISNAVKFTHHNGRILIKAFESGNDAVVEVIDNGVGISKENIKRLFNVVSEFSQPGTEKERGTGLGLILCNEFLALNNGSIEVQSTPGEGSTFRIRLPRM